MIRLASLGVTAVALWLAVGGPDVPVGGTARSEVVVLLDAPPLGRAPGTAAKIDADQRAFRRELADTVPSAQVGWRYRLVANGFSVTLPSAEVSRLRVLPGVRDVLPTTTYAPRESSGPAEIGAPSLWGEGLATAGQGVKIGIIDSGIDASHAYFAPAGYSMPAGFPKGQERFTTAKVIVARVFPPKSGATASSVRLAFSPSDNPHGTHVAGIAAGNAETPTGQGRISGVAPRAYLGNYKVFVDTDSGLSPNANSPAIVAAIEAAVADGMDVINFSGGEPEIEPQRDIVALALDAAAAVGVVPVIAAGNDYNDFGAGSVSSPANAEAAIAEAHARRLLLRRSDGRLPSPEARRRRSGCRRPLLGRRRRVGRVLGHEHGHAARRRGSGSARSAASLVERGADQVSARADRHRLGRGRQSPGRTAFPGRRRRGAAACGPAIPLCEADGAVARPPSAWPGAVTDSGARRRRRRSRKLERLSRHPQLAGASGPCHCPDDGERARRARRLGLGDSSVRAR
jgi:subtilisin family serine protease